jgi:hypothetical protein
MPTPGTRTSEEIAQGFEVGRPGPPGEVIPAFAARSRPAA